jgi:hypothetical protein
VSGGRARPYLCIGTIVLAALTLTQRDAGAAPLTVRLEYTVAAGCPDAADFKGVVISRLGHDPFVERAPYRVLVQIARGADAIDGRIEWRDASGQWVGEQAFPAVTTDCPHLVRSIGFALAVQIQLLARAPAPPEDNVAPPAEAASSPATAPPPAVANPPLPAEPPKEAIASRGDLGPAPAGAPRPVLAMGAGPSVELGMSSSPVLLGRLFGAVAWPHLSVELAALVSVPATTRRPDGGGFSQQHLLGSAAACATAVRWSACLVTNAGEVRMAGVDVDRPSTATVALVQAGARLAVEQALGRRAFVKARGEALVNLVRWTGRLDQLPVWTAPPYSGSIGVDVGVRFR